MRATVGAAPNFSEAPHFSSSIYFAQKLAFKRHKGSTGVGKTNQNKLRWDPGTIASCPIFVVYQYQVPGNIYMQKQQEDTWHTFVLAYDTWYLVTRTTSHLLH